MFPQLQSKCVLETPLLAGQTASLVMVLMKTADSFLTNPLPFQPHPSHFSERCHQQSPTPETEQAGHHMPEMDTKLWTSSL